MDQTLIEIEIDSLAVGGEGVGRDSGGRVTFVRGGVPGDRVVVELIEEHKKYARGRVAEVLASSPDRVEAPCELFRQERCGGCQWQHVAMPTQRAAKAEHVARAFRELIGEDCAIAPIRAPCSDYGWRRRARLHWFRPPKSEAAIVGFCAPRSRRVAPVHECLQVTAALQAVLAPIHEHLAPGLHKRGEIDLLADAAGRVLVQVRGPASHKAVVALAACEGIAGVTSGRRVVGDEQATLEGGQVASARSFVQASEDGNRALCEAVLEAAGPLQNLRVLEFYAGSGNFTLPLAAAAAQVVAIERAGSGPAELPANVAWHVGRAERLAPSLASRASPFDVVVLDPPRTGARELMGALCELGARRIVYVSCDPATASRDAADLQGLYRLVELHPLDLMPQTPHVELVAVFEHREVPPHSSGGVSGAK